MAAPEQVEVPRAARPAMGHPTVIVDDVHVVYKVKSDRSASTPKNRHLPSGPARSREVHAVRGVSFVAHEGEADRAARTQRLREVDAASGHDRDAPATKGAVYAQGQPTLLGVGAALMGELSGSRKHPPWWAGDGPDPQGDRRAL